MIGWFLLALAAPVQAAPGDICATPGACRRVDTVRIETPDGKEYTLPINQTLPWVVQGNLMLMPGDTITIRLVDRDGALFPELVRAGPDTAGIAPGEGEIQIKVLPYNKGNLVMAVHSRRTDTLDYGALIVGPAARGSAQRTSVCSLMPGITVFESWTQPIRQIALFGFRRTTQPGCKTIDMKKDAGEPSPAT